MNVIKIDPQYKEDLLVIKFMIGNTCNYKCWYCFPGSHEGTHRWPTDVNLIYENLGHLIKHYKTIGKTKIRLHILGGEPTLWPELGNFIKYFKNNYSCDITMSTNASRSVRWWNEHGEYFDDVIISCHHERADINHIKNVADILYDKKVMVQTMVLMDPTNWNKCVSIVDQLLESKKKWYVTCSEVAHYSLNLLTTDQKNYLKNSVKRKPGIIYRLRYERYHNHEKDSVITTDEKKLKVKKNWLLMNKVRNFKGFICNIGVDILFIDVDGVITGSCGNHLYNLDYYFNIYDEEFTKKFNINIVPTTCSKDLCSVCNDELNLFKFKSF
jgi:organic radical activating enzyme